jgi:Ion channel
VVGDLRVGETGRHEAQHLPLALAERWRLGWRLRHGRRAGRQPLLAEGGQKLPHGLGGDALGGCLPENRHQPRAGIEEHPPVPLASRQDQSRLQESHRPSSATFFLVKRGQIEHAFPLGYYSFMTITSVGFGDIVPVATAARALTVLEALVGQIYLVVLVARLMGIHIAQHMERRQGA